ncbi:MAG: DUF2179 domain-containing protein [Gammaproteobacteria bacterium]
MEFLSAYPWVLPVAIFFARIVDVSLGTVRTIVVFRGYRALAAGIGFVELIIWTLASAQVLGNLDKWYLVIAYAGGFGTGNYVGIWLESKLAIGSEMVRAVSFRGSGHLAETLRANGFKAIELAGSAGPGQPCEVVLIVTKRRKIRRLLALITQTDPDAVYSLSDVKQAYEGPAALLQGRQVFNSGWRVLGKRK